MNEDQITDLKQFITATVSQSEARLEAKLGGRIEGVEGHVGLLEKRVGSLEQKLTERTDSRPSRATKVMSGCWS